MAQVSLKNIALQGVGAAEPFSLEVRDREFVVLAGPQGCGHSLLLRLIAGLNPLPGGEIVIGNRPVHLLPPVQRDVAMVFSQPALFPHWSVAQNIAFGLRGRHFPKTEVGKRVREAADIAGVAELLDRRPASLSALEGLRVALARAIVRQPKLILLDHPLAGLDALARPAMRAELVKLQERLQTTVLYATSDPLEAMALGHRVALMEAGQLTQFDAPLAVYRQPANLFAARFLGQPRINLLPGRLRSAAQGVLFKENGGTVEVAFADAPKEWVGKEVVLGVRPEELEPGEVSKSRGARCQGIVDHVEVNGAETLYYIETGANTVILRASGSGEAGGAGRRMAFDIDPARVHLFDAETKARLA
jgi:multiple sugar transport system ATP-binding protein